MKKYLLAAALILLGSHTFSQVENGLIAKYPFNGNAMDVVGGHDGMVGGATLTTDRFGMSNAAYHFNADSSQYIEVPYSPDLTPGSEPRTISLWFQAMPSDTSGGFMISWYRCGANPTCSTVDAATYALLLTSDSSQVYYWARDDDNNDTVYVSATAFNNGDWHHAVMVFDPALDYRKYYINDIELDSVPFNMTTLSDGGLAIPLSIGRIFRTGWDDPGAYYSGKIDDIRIYNRALSAIEVDSLYHEGGFVGISSIEAQVDVSVFPNPTNGIVNIQNRSDHSMQFTLFNVLGEEILSETIGVGTNSIDLSSLASNIYYYRLSSEKQLLSTGKLVKQ